MGTNYYMTSRSDPQSRAGSLHIGKSSGGWCFALHIVPEMGLSSWDDWIDLLSCLDALIHDEYGSHVTLSELIRVVTDRRRDNISKPDETFLRQNHAMVGPNGLVRSQVDGWHCVGHGPGTWDLITGEFS